MAQSFLSVEQAKRNYKRELHEKPFSVLKNEAERAWEDMLSRIAVSGENAERRNMFYSCLYRAMLYPRVFHEYDEGGMPVHYNADTQKTESGVFYTDNGFWDTYRTVYPLLSIIAPDRVREMIEGFVNYAEETGWLPKWLSPGEFGLMPGTLAEAVIADACVKGIVGGELRARAYKALLKNAYESGAGTRHGRTGIEEYIRYGYVPSSFRESVNHTCDCAYGDFCIAQVARLEGDEAGARALIERSKNYANLFDPESKFLRGKDAERKFKPNFNPFDWGGDYCEGSAWQNGFAVYHDLEGFSALYGGKEQQEVRRAVRGAARVPYGRIRRRNPRNERNGERRFRTVRDFQSAEFSSALAVLCARRTEKNRILGGKARQRGVRLHGRGLPRRRG